MKKNFLYILLFITPGLFAQQVPAGLQILLNQKLDSICAFYQIQGLQTAAYLPSYGLWQNSFGYSYPQVPINNNMVFGIASNTKTFTAALILKFIEAGKLNLLDTIGKWFPNHPNLQKKITIKQLLNHTSGIRAYNNIPGYADSLLFNPERIFRFEELISWIGPQLFDPGTAFNYSNSNFMLAGAILFRLTGVSMSKLFRDSIFIPLALSSTYFGPEPIPDSIAHPWENKTDNFNQNRNSILSAATTAGAIYASATNMVNWYNYLFNGNFLSNTSKLNQIDFNGNFNYGLGLQRFNINNSSVFGHSGFIKGSYNSMVLFDSLHKFSVCVLVNEERNLSQPVIMVLHKTIKDYLNANTTFIPTNNNYSDITVYPNPVYDWLTVDDDNYSEISLYNLYGNKCLTTNNKNIEISQLPAGVYYLIATKINSSIVVVKKIVKK